MMSPVLPPLDRNSDTFGVCNFENENAIGSNLHRVGEWDLITSGRSGRMWRRTQALPGLNSPYMTIYAFMVTLVRSFLDNSEALCYRL